MPDQPKIDALYDVHEATRRHMAAELWFERACALGDDIAISVAVIDRDGAKQDLRDVLSRTGPLLLRGDPPAACGDTVAELAERLELVTAAALRWKVRAEAAEAQLAAEVACG